MRQITIKAHNAFKNRRNFSSTNTQVIRKGDEMHMLLFGNLIAKTVDDEIWISDGGWGASATTRERLSPFIDIRMDKEVFIINEQFVWDGDWLNTNKINE